LRNDNDCIILFRYLVEIMDLLLKHLAGGLVNSEIRHFGGEDCYNEIPFLYHVIVCISLTSISLYTMYRYRDRIIDNKIVVDYIPPNLFEKIVFFIGLVVLIATFYLKMVRLEGFFMLNPCHVSIVMLLILLRGDNSSPAMRKLYIASTGWIFGIFAALIIPHL
jgi:hypothetical protein